MNGLSNLPPGVSGNEPQIAGYDESQENRACEYPATLKVIDQYDEHLISILRRHLDADDGQRVKRAAQMLIGGLSTITIDECPYEGEVTVYHAQLADTWECPLCGAEHEEAREPR